MSKILLLNGSPVYPSRCAALLAHCQTVAQSRRWSVQSLAVQSLDAHALLAAKASHPSMASAFEAIGQAEAIVAATPTYKAAYAGVLKAFLDLAPPNALAGKKVLPFMLGATPLHALALDFSFKPLFMAMGAGRLASGAFFLDERFTKQDGQYVLTPELAEQVSKMLVDFIEV